MWIWMLIASAIALLGKSIVRRHTTSWALLSIAYTVSVHAALVLLLYALLSGW